MTYFRVGLARPSRYAPKCCPALFSNIAIGLPGSPDSHHFVGRRHQEEQLPGASAKTDSCSGCLAWLANQLKHFPLAKAWRTAQVVILSEADQAWLPQVRSSWAQQLFHTAGRAAAACLARDLAQHCGAVRQEQLPPDLAQAATQCLLKSAMA